MIEHTVPKPRQASDLDFETFGRPSKDRAAAMTHLVRGAMLLALNHNPDLDLSQQVAVPYVGHVRISSLLALPEQSEQ